MMSGNWLPAFRTDSAAALRLKRLTTAGLAFFLIKGLFWVALAWWAVR